MSRASSQLMRHVAGLAAVLGIALAVRVEIHPLHRMKDALVRVDQRLHRQGVRRHEGAAGRAELAAAGLDHPGGRIGVVELDRRDPQDPAVLDVDEQRTAIGASGVAAAAVWHGRSHLQAGGLAHVEGLGEPDHHVVRPGGHHLEVLGRVDDLALVAVGQQQLQRRRHVLECHRHLRLGRGATAGTDPAVPDLRDAADAAVLEADPCDDVALPQPRAERGEARGGEVQRLRQGEEDTLQNLPAHS